jgi:hypothetical protein
MTRLLRTSGTCFLSLLSCRVGSAAGQGDGGGATAAAASTSLNAPASPLPNVCSVISVEDVARTYHLPVTKAQGIANGARCDYTSSQGPELFISLNIWHGTNSATHLTQDPHTYLDDMRRGRGMGHVFGSLHPISGLGDDAVWVAYALVPTPGNEPTAPTNVQVVVRRGDSLVCVIRPLPEAEATSDAFQEQMANNAKAVLPKLLALLGT